MKRSRFILAASFVGAGLTAQTAAAASVHDGVTFAELSNALSDGLAVTTSTLSDGDKILFAQGQKHLIAAVLVHCGASDRCDGVRYFSVIDEKLSPTFINRFNYRFDYSKITTDSRGKHAISVEQQASGGVTDTNLLNNALTLMVRMSDLKKITDAQVSLETPGAVAALSANTVAARTQEGFANLRATNAPPVALDPAVVRAFIEQAAELAK